MPKLGTSIRIISAVAAAAFLAVIVVGTANAKAVRQSSTIISGAGSTFVAPLIAQWISPIGSAYGYELQYSAVGSGAGITSITSRTVDFGASDAPLSPDQFTACNGCEQIPWALGATAVLYNLPGVKSLLHMTGPVLADIFSGKVTTWDNPKIAKLNPGVSLPSTKISIAHRSDNSGTTYNFTDYLSHVSPSWKAQIGTGVAVNWPVGSAGKGSSGVAAIVSQTPGAIGYADIAYALTNHLKYFAMKNAAGKFTTPGLRAMVSAAQSDVHPAADNSLSIVDPPANKKYINAYPICTFTYVIVPLQSSKAAQLRKFLFWAVTKGQTYGPRILFQPLPKPVLVVDEKAIAKIHS
ncbi:MAG TPA: phosphate ABC transporter substrate-binding protein PstS [Gaiellaceae bacterium]|nr:phosphate ABC transporter substrate-binding protein PstS [Gaiellaceae bacterium]